MGTITISVDDEMETRFRETVKEEVGVGKGKLGAAVEEALKLWVAQKQEEEIVERQIAWMEKGFQTGKIVFEREELHERKY
ncbi:MAG TPA: hypothetical protein VJC21_02785 [Candidatus Nanoarchaeia archaeon]|nr:hypothetical protein [Candidatus Nanoarchaeia archaeon]